MSSFSLPQDVLSRPVSPYRGHPATRTQSRAQKVMTTTFCLDHSKRLDDMYFFGSLIDTLRRCYRIRTQVPEVPDSERRNSSSFAEYIDRHVISPILSLFDQTRQSYTSPLRSDSIEILNGQAVIRTFRTDCPSETSYPLFVFTIPGLLEFKEWEMDSISCSSTRVYDVLAKIASTSTIYDEAVVTDLTTFVCLKPTDAPNPTKFQCELWSKPPLDHPTLVAIAAFLPYHRYLDQNVDEFSNIRGVINNPTLPLPSEESVLNRRAREDFDLYTLRNSREHALQYFRWANKAIQNALLHPIEVGNMISVVTNGFEKRYVQGAVGRPYTSIPEETLRHFKLNQRPQPLVQSLLEQSECFTIRVDEILKPADQGSKLGITVICSLVSISPLPADCPSPIDQQLCLKILDDRLAPFEPPDEGMGPEYWFADYCTSQDLVRDEDAVYRSLDVVQGSLVPWYLGAHTLTLPDGQEVLGILMELVPGKSLDQSSATEMLRDAEEDVQIEFIKSARHAVKVLQSLDISQLDWYNGQLMVVPASALSGSSSLGIYYHAGLIDFAACGLTSSAYNGCRTDDYGAVQEILVDADEGVGLRKELVRKWFGGRERWDCYLTDHTVD